MAEKNKSQRNIFIYFSIAIGFSWLFWVPAIFVDQNIMNTPWVILLYAGGLGPALGGILLTHLNQDPKLRKEYWDRVFNFKRVGGLWYLVILFAYPILTALFSFIEDGQIQITEAFQDLLIRPVGLIPFLLFLFIFGPFPEELGWRGYALDELQDRMNPITASLFLGAIWAFWHLPLFLMQGTFQYDLGLGSAAFWRFILSAILISVFISWIYNNNQRSILSASLFHFSVNFTGNVFLESDVLITTRIVVLVVLSILLFSFTRKNGLLGYMDRNKLPYPRSPSTLPGGTN